MVKITGNLKENRPKWYSFIDLKGWAILLTGLLMIGVYSFTDLFENGLSSVIYHITQGIYLFCCFIYIFFKLAIRKEFRFGMVKDIEDKEEGDHVDGGPERFENESKEKVKTIRREVQHGMKVKTNYVEAFFIPIRLLTILYIATNLLSAGFYFYNNLYYKKKHVIILQTDLLTIDNILKQRKLSEKEIIDSVNLRFPKQLFFSAGKVLSMRLDTGGAFIYYYNLRDLGHDVAISEWNVKIFNFTNCKEKWFCNCDSTNICLKNKTIELYYLLVTRKTKKGARPDTSYYSRIL